MPQAAFIQAEEAAHHDPENESKDYHARADVYEDASRGLSGSSLAPDHVSSCMGEVKAQKILHSQEGHRQTCT